MNKQLSATFMLAGTAIGSGMISLPIVLSHIGMFPTVLLILLCVFVTYVSALVRAELNLHSNSRFTLEDVGLRFSGPIAALIGNISIKMLSFSLLSAYIYGLSAIISDGCVASKIIVAGFTFVLMAFSSDRIITFNKKLFIALLVLLLCSLIGMIFNVNFVEIPKIYHEIQWPKLFIILPTLFTSFGFQGSLHSLTKFCNNNETLIRRACFWGSLIPAIVYIVWTFGVMALIFNSQPDLFYKMLVQSIDIRELISALCNISNTKFINTAVFIISLLAIATSIIGVGVALVDDLEMTIERSHMAVDEKIVRPLCAAMAVIPSALIAIIIPGAFVKILSFAGMILSVIAIFLPAFLVSRIKSKIKFRILERKEFIYLIIMFGIIIFMCEAGLLCYKLM